MAVVGELTAVPLLQSQNVPVEVLPWLPPICGSILPGCR